MNRSLRKRSISMYDVVSNCSLIGGLGGWMTYSLSLTCTTRVGAFEQIGEFIGFVSYILPQLSGWGESQILLFHVPFFLFYKSSLLWLLYFLSVFSRPAFTETPSFLPRVSPLCHWSAIPHVCSHALFPDLFMLSLLFLIFTFHIYF